MDLKCKETQIFEREGKKKIYILGHEKNSKYFEEIADKILKVYKHYVIYWNEENLVTITEEEIHERREFLKDIDLIVVVVDKDFAKKNNIAYKYEFNVAKEYYKEILPILVDEEEDFINESIGNMQYLKYKDENFEEKLDYFINKKFDPYNLVSKERLENPFENVPNVFLSYRKKDYKLIQKLLGSIRKMKGLENLAIWFDDFLVTGENFNETIKEKLEESDFLLICISKNMLEKNNYVQRIEYPLAKQLGKKIIPVVMDNTSQEEIDSIFPGLYCNGIKFEDKLSIEKNIYKLIQELGLTMAILSPEKVGELGQAYFEGEKIEQNVLLGIELIKKSAEAGYPLSHERLGRLYISGYRDIIERDINKAIFWLTKSLEYNYGELQKLEDDSHELFNYGTMSGYTAYELFKLSYYSMKNTDLAIYYLDIFYKISCKIKKHIFTSIINPGVALYHNGEILEDAGDFRGALNYYNESEFYLLGCLGTKTEIAHNYYINMLYRQAKTYEKIIEKERQFDEKLVNGVIGNYHKAVEKSLEKNKIFGSDDIVKETIYLAEWSNFISINEKNIHPEIVRNNYIQIYKISEVIDEKALEVDLLYLRGMCLINLACFNVEVPDKKLLEIAYFYTKKGYDISREERFNKVLYMIEMRLEAWPMNLG